MILETSVSKRMPIKGVPYSSQSFSITIRNDESTSNIEEVRSKCIEMHDFLEKIVDTRLSLIRNQPEIIALPKAPLPKRSVTEKQLALIHKLMAENENLNEVDLMHAINSAYSIGKLSELSTVEASMIIQAIKLNDLTKI
jgi:hypothetical protein